MKWAAILSAIMAVGFISAQPAFSYCHHHHHWRYYNRYNGYNAGYMNSGYYPAAYGYNPYGYGYGGYGGYGYGMPLSTRVSNFFRTF